MAESERWGKAGLTRADLDDALLSVVARLDRLDVRELNLAPERMLLREALDRGLGGHKESLWSDWAERVRLVLATADLAAADARIERDYAERSGGVSAGVGTEGARVIAAARRVVDPDEDAAFALDGLEAALNALDEVRIESAERCGGLVGQDAPPAPVERHQPPSGDAPASQGLSALERRVSALEVREDDLRQAVTAQADTDVEHRIALDGLRGSVGTLEGKDPIADVDRDALNRRITEVAGMVVTVEQQASDIGERVGTLEEQAKLAASGRRAIKAKASGTAHGVDELAERVEVLEKRDAAEAWSLGVRVAALERATRPLPYSDERGTIAEELRRLDEREHSNSKWQGTALNRIDALEQTFTEHGHEVVEESDLAARVSALEGKADRAESSLHEVNEHRNREGTALAARISALESVLAEGAEQGDFAARIAALEDGQGTHTQVLAEARADLRGAKGRLEVLNARANTQGKGLANIIDALLEANVVEVKPPEPEGE